MPSKDTPPAELDVGQRALAPLNRRALVIAELLQALIRSRRYHLDEFIDGDGPYWIAIGLFIDGEHGMDTTMERAMEFADESIETSRHLLQQMITRKFVQQYTTRKGSSAYRLSPSFAQEFGRYLRYQLEPVQTACARLH